MMWGTIGATLVLVATLVVSVLSGCDALDGRGEPAEAPAREATGSVPLPDPDDFGPVPDGAVGPLGFRSVLPEGNFREPCQTDADCDEPYSCLQSRSFGAGSVQLVCSQTCTRASDCPPVFNEHCGELTLCDNGICGFLGCQ